MKSPSSLKERDWSLPIEFLAEPFGDTKASPSKLRFDRAPQAIADKVAEVLKESVPDAKD